MIDEHYTLEWVLNFIANRIRVLREAKGVSAQSMSIDLGQNVAYVHKIENQSAKPSIEGLYNICVYFQIELKEFFNDDAGNDTIDVYLELLEEMKDLEREQLQVLRDTVRQFKRRNESATPRK